MATIYSLICFGGKGDSKIVTFGTSNLVTLTNHGLRDGTGVRFSGGTLPTQNGGPTALAANTTYYAKGSVGASTFELYTDAALTPANKILFNNDDSGTIYIKSAYYAGLSDKSRWTVSGTEYIFDSLSSWRTHRFTTVPSLPADSEVCEIGMAWTDIISATLTLNLASATTLITPINDAGHGGVKGAGYVLQATNSYSARINMSGYNTTVYGINVYASNDGDTVFNVQSVKNKVDSCIIYGNGSLTVAANGVTMQTSANTCINNVIMLCGRGIVMSPFVGTGSYVANNTCVKNVTGMYSETSSLGFVYNNVSVGNSTANWTANYSGLTGAGYNAGISTDQPWYKGTDTSIKTATADNTTFKDYTNNDFRPAGDSAAHTSSSPLVDVATVSAFIDEVDIDGNLRPSYKNGSATGWDIGAYEFDWGYGDPPASGTLAGTNIINGTRIKIAKQSDGTEIVNAVVSGTTKSDSFTGANQDVYIYARKGSAAPYYKSLRISGSIVDGNLSYDLAGLQVEDIAAATYTAGVATDWTFNSGTGAITHASGTTRYSVQDLYSWHQDYYDDSATVDDNPLINGITPMQFELINNGLILDSAMPYLYGGSIEFTNGALWSSLYTAGSLAASHNIYVVQDDEKLFQHWAAGHIDILVQVKA